jgi:hypothetical protein
MNYKLHAPVLLSQGNLTSTQWLWGHTILHMVCYENNFSCSARASTLFGQTISFLTESMYITTSYKKKKLRGLSPRANYTYRTNAACWRSKCQLLRIDGCRVVSTTDPYGRILSFLDRSRYFSFQVAPQLYSRGWVDPITDALLLRKSVSAENRTRPSGSVAKNSDH